MGPYGSNGPTWAHVDPLDSYGPMDPYGSIGCNGPNRKMGPKADVLDGPHVLMGQAHGAQDPGPYLRTADLSKIVSWKRMFHVKK